MTLQQLKYVITLAEVGMITEAAENSLFRSQAGQKGRTGTDHDKVSETGR